MAEAVIAYNRNFFVIFLLSENIFVRPNTIPETKRARCVINENILF